MKGVNDSILIANFQSNPQTTVIVAYSPTNTSSLEVTEEFYNKLKDTVKNVPAHNFLMILGDFNARLAKEDFRYSFHSESNRNGDLLSEFITENQLTVTNTMFQKSKGKYWTFQSPRNDKFQIDYILVRRKWRNSILNSEAFSSFSSVGSDHRIVTAKIRLSLRSPKKSLVKNI